MQRVALLANQTAVRATRWITLWQRVELNYFINALDIKAISKP